jgi:hypothetical protein
VACSCYLSDAKSLKQEELGLGLPGQKVRLYLQNNQSKKCWRCGSSSNVLASEVQSPEFKPQQGTYTWRGRGRERLRIDNPQNRRKYFQIACLRKTGIDYYIKKHYLNNKMTKQY